MPRSRDRRPFLVLVVAAVACSHDGGSTQDGGPREAFTDSARDAAGIPDRPVAGDTSYEAPLDGVRETFVSDARRITRDGVEDADTRFDGEDVNLDRAVELTTAAWGSDPVRRGGLGYNGGGSGGPVAFAGAAVEFSRLGEAGGGGGHASEGVGRAPLPASKSAPFATWKRSRLVPNASRLRVGDTEELPLDGVEATVRVDGARARVVLDCLFRNDRDRALEGMFELRLPDEASPFFFAFGESTGAPASPAVSPPAVAPPPADVQRMLLGMAVATASASSPDGIVASRQATWTAPKEARMVPREKAAWAYTEVSRRGVDPALMEWSGAGVFSARVFPLAPGKTHRVVVGYDVDLVAAGDELELRLDLPQGVPQRSVTLSVAAGEGISVSPTVTASAVDGRSVYSFRNPDDAAITLRLAHPGATLLTGDDAAAGSCFAGTFKPQLPATSAAPASPLAVFMVDTSLSSDPERFPVWLKLVREILDRNRGSLREFAVLFFDVQTRWWKDGFVANTRENVDAFLAAADGLALEGATDLGAALAEAVEPAWEESPSRPPRYDVFLLSDGASTWGGADVAALDATLARGHRGALFAYQTGQAGTDAATLAHLARETGGAVFSVVGEAEIPAAATAHTRRGFRIRGLSVDGGSDLLLAGRPASVFPGQSLRLAGRGAPKAGTPIVLTLEQDGVETKVATTPARVLRSELASRAYGQIAVGQIEELGDVPASPAQAYATHYRVVGSTCSLLMLETDADYERYGIRPEADAARVRAEPASEYVARTITSRLGEAADPRAGILAWLRRMEATPGVEFHAPADLVAAIGRMPARSFEVGTAPLACKPRRWADVPGPLTEQFASRELTYDVVSAEAKRVLDASGPADALRVLSSLVEANPGDTALARDVGFSALEWGLSGQAVHLFRRVARARPYEPETYRALGDAFARSGNADLAIVYGEAALAGKWDERFGAFRLVAAMDHLRLLRRIDRGEIATSVPDFAASRRKALEKEFLASDPGLVVVITWNTDRTDVDLHVTDPRNEECFYSHPRTAIGGAITQDVTQGYGPEMFVVADPVPGDYFVRAHYFASDTSRASLRSKVLATVYERWGTREEKVTRRVVLLAEGERTEDIATVRIGK